MKCTRCIGGQYVSDEGRLVCLQCGYDPQMAWFRDNRLPDVPVLTFPGGAREGMGSR